MTNGLGEPDKTLDGLIEIYEHVPDVDFFCHEQCYGHFTDNSKVKRLEEKVKKKDDAYRLNEPCNTDIVVSDAENIYHLVQSMS